MDLKKLIKKCIYKNEKLLYWYKCCTFSKNGESRNKVIKIDSDYTRVELMTANGDKKIPYVIQVGSPTIGFFALLRLTINAIAYAEYYGLMPVVIFNDCVAYKEQNAINGKTNPFEYYFMQPNEQNISYDAAINEYSSVAKCIPEHYTQVYNLFGLKDVPDYLIEKEHYQFLGRMYGKYMRLQPQIEELLKRDMGSIHFCKNSIGIHYRGTDFKNNYGSHPVAVTVEDYIAAVERLDSSYNDYKIFIATDDFNALEKFKTAFGNRMYGYSDVQRASGNLSVICTESKRENHHFLLGYEVIRDMITLSECDVLIAGLSQVSIFSRIAKISRGEKFKKEVLISKGINHNRRSHVDSIKKARNM